MIYDLEFGEVMSIFYIVALVIASIFWLCVIIWLIAGTLAKRKAIPKKQPATNPLIDKKITNDQKIEIQSTAQVNDSQHDQLR